MFGAHSVYVSNDGMATWAQQTTQDLTGGCNSGECALEDLEIAPSDHTKAYALAMETSTTFRPTPFKIFTTDQADMQVSASQPEGAEWTDKTAQLPPIVFPDSTQATGIAVDPFDSSVAYLSLSGFTAATGMGHVFVTTDFGGSWTQADGNPDLQSPPPANALPDVPVLRLLVDRNDPTANTVLAATDIGIFRTTDGGTTWAPFNLGAIPAVAVFDIEQNLSGVVFAATHGRGIFELSGEGSPGATPTSTPTAAGSATPTPTPTRRSPRLQPEPVLPRRRRRLLHPRRRPRHRQRPRPRLQRALPRRPKPRPKCHRDRIADGVRDRDRDAIHHRDSLSDANSGSHPGHIADADIHVRPRPRRPPQPRPSRRRRCRPWRRRWSSRQAPRVSPRS